MIAAGEKIAPLAALLHHVAPIDSVLGEIIEMRLELLADFVNLPLKRFAVARIDAHQLADARFDALDERIIRREVAAIARPVIRVGMVGEKP